MPGRRATPTKRAYNPLWGPRTEYDIPPLPAPCPTCFIGLATQQHNKKTKNKEGNPGDSSALANEIRPVRSNRARISLLPSETIRCLQNCSTITQFDRISTIFVTKWTIHAYFWLHCGQNALLKIYKIACPYKFTGITVQTWDWKIHHHSRQHVDTNHPATIGYLKTFELDLAMNHDEWRKLATLLTSGTTGGNFYCFVICMGQHGSGLWFALNHSIGKHLWTTTNVCGSLSTQRVRWYGSVLADSSL